MEGIAIEPREKLERLVKVAAEKKADGITVLDVTGLTSYADYFLLASGASNRQVKAMANALVEEAKKAGSDVLGVEGLASAKWVLIDLGDVVAHLFFEPVRAFYDLEGLWTDAPRVDLSSILGAPPSASASDDDDDDDDYGDDDD